MSNTIKNDLQTPLKTLIFMSFTIKNGLKNGHFYVKYHQK